MNKYFNNIDYRWFERTLTTEVIEAFDDLKKVRSENVYYCGLVTEEFVTLNVFWMTEEMLDLAVENEIKHDRTILYNSMRSNLRWRYRYQRYSVDEESIYTFNYLPRSRKIMEGFDNTFSGKLIDAKDAKRMDVFDEIVAEIRDVHEPQFRQACFNALQNLNEINYFGSQQRRKKIILNLELILRYDENTIPNLNPPKAVNRYHIERSKSEYL